MEGFLKKKTESFPIFFPQTLEAVCLCAFDYDINSVEDPDHAGVQTFQRMLASLQLK